ncbi:hypothetical protein V8E36_009264 [Tilletia maclaganii]
MSRDVDAACRPPPSASALMTIAHDSVISASQGLGVAHLPVYRLGLEDDACTRQEGLGAAGVIHAFCVLPVGKKVSSGDAIAHSRRYRSVILCGALGSTTCRHGGRGHCASMCVCVRYSYSRLQARLTETTINNLSIIALCKGSRLCALSLWGRRCERAPALCRSSDPSSATKLYRQHTRHTPAPDEPSRQPAFGSLHHGRGHADTDLGILRKRQHALEWRRGNLPRSAGLQCSWPRVTETMRAFEGEKRTQRVRGRARGPLSFARLVRCSPPRLWQHGRRFWSESRGICAMSSWGEEGRGGKG